MGPVNFEEFCQAVCEFSGAGSGACEPDGEGGLALTLSLDGVALTFVDPGEARPGFAVVIADAGCVPSASEQETWRDLLQRNAHLLPAEEFAFSRNPRTGEVHLHCATDWREEDVAQVLARVHALARCAREWQAGGLAGPPRSDDLAECRRPGMKAVRFPIGSLAPQRELEALQMLMSANFSLMAHPRSAAYCIAPSTGGICLQVLLPADDSSTAELLDYVAHAAEIGIALSPLDMTFEEKLP